MPRVQVPLKKAKARLWASNTISWVAPGINPRQRLSAPLIAKLGRPRSDHLAHDLPRYPKLAADRLDRLLLNEKRATDLCDRLHYQHPQTSSHVPHGSHCGPLVPGVPIGCRSPRKRGPYSMRIHTPMWQTGFAACSWPAVLMVLDP